MTHAILSPVSLSVDERPLAICDHFDLTGLGEEPEFADLVTLATAVCGVPIGHISLIDSETVWIRAARGVQVDRVSRSVSFCDYAVRGTGLFMVPDASKDARFSENAWVSPADGIRFYAGFPLRLTGGTPFGALCVVDRRPRKLTLQQQEALRVLADQVVARMELRAQRRAMREAVRVQELATIEASRMRRRFETFMDSGPFIAYMKDADGRMLYYNRQLAERFGVSRVAMLGKTDDELWPADLASSYREHDMTVLSSGRSEVSQERTRNRDGSYSTWQSHKFPCRSDSGDPLLGGVSIDITEQLRREEELVRTQKELQQVNLLLSELATTDALTGLPLRRVFETRLATAIEDAKRQHRPFSLFMIDVDNFKRHNDCFGHPHGDALLQSLAKALDKELRASDFITRYGGEEFAIGATNTAMAEAMVIASRLLNAVRAIKVNEQRVTISIGVAELGTSMQASDLMQIADEGLLKAKRLGKDRVVASSSLSMQDETVRKT